MEPAQRRGFARTNQGGAGGLHPLEALAKTTHEVLDLTIMTIMSRLGKDATMSGLAFKRLLGAPSIWHTGGVTYIW